MVRTILGWDMSWLDVLVVLVVVGSVTSPAPGPVFDSHLPATLTVQQGDTAYLHCRIFNAENM